MGPQQPDGPKVSKFGRVLRSALNLEPMPRRRQDGDTAERERAIRSAFDNLRATCRRGDVVVYFPEGSRSPDGTIRRFRSGIDELAAELDEPVIPVYIDGAHALWPKGKRWTRRGALTITIGDAMTSIPDGPPLAARLENEIRRLGGERSDSREQPMEHMKWWGWGDANVSFTHADKPDLGPFIREKIDIDLDGRPSKVLDFDDLDIAEPIIGDEFAAALSGALRDDQITSDAMERVVHTYGKSLRDLVRIRRGDLGRLPDLIVYPENEDEVGAIMAAALANDVVVIPFGGGTNISESLEPPRGERRTVVSVDMQKMDQVLEIDEAARTARVQAGVFGPHLEEQLNRTGWTLGHFPDSFTYSTLGGWIATRSSPTEPTWSRSRPPPSRAPRATP
mgnify:FL=1